MEKPSQEEKFPGFFHKHIAEVAPWSCFQSQSAPAGLSPRWGVTLSCFAPTLGDGCHAQGNQRGGCCSQTTFPELQSLPRAVSWSSWDKAQAPAFTHILVILHLHSENELCLLYQLLRACGCLFPFPDLGFHRWTLGTVEGRRKSKCK